jgi:tetratricopeptide (TPR) repeat protein
LASLPAYTGWLLVLDNVELRADVEVLPGQLTSGNVLVTSRRDVGWEPLVAGCAQPDLLSSDEAARLLLERSGQADANTAVQLASELGFLPLALQQAAAYLAQTRIPMADYLQRLRDQPIGLLEEIARGDDARRTVTRVCQVTLTAIRDTHLGAVDLLGLLACYAPDNIPGTILTGEVENPADTDRALALLRSYNMITLDETSVSVHPLVQVVVRHQGNQTDAALPDRATIRARAVSRLRSAVPRGDPGCDVDGWPLWRTLIPHIHAVAALFDQDATSLDLAWVLGQAGAYLSAQGRYAESLANEERALAISEKALDPDDPALATRLGNLASTLRALGRAGEALPLEQRALATMEKTLGPDHLYVGIQLGNLALSLQDLGRSGEALSLLELSLAISERALGPDHTDVALRLGNLAGALWDLGWADEALPLQQRALAISEKALGPDHPDVATRLGNLGAVLWDLGRAVEAVPLEQRALGISEKALGPDHPDVATRLANLAGSLRDLGRAGEAMPLQQRALAISEKALGRDHPTTMAIRSHLDAR